MNCDIIVRKKNFFADGSDKRGAQFYNKKAHEDNLLHPEKLFILKKRYLAYLASSNLLFQHLLKFSLSTKR